MAGCSRDGLLDLVPGWSRKVHPRKAQMACELPQRSLTRHGHHEPPLQEVWKVDIGFLGGDIDS